MNIEASDPTNEQLHLKEVTIPPEATHEDELRSVINSLNSHGYAIVVGPSHAGKTTFLKHSLPAVLQENGYENPVFLDCMTALSREVVPELLTRDSPIILDETTRMARDPGFVHSLKERLLTKRPTVICATLFDTKGEESELRTLLSELPIGEAADSMVDFPLAMSQKDASRLIEKLLPEASSDFILELTELTTQPYLLRLILSEVRKNGQTNLNSSVQSVLQNSYITQSILAEARSLWRKITPSPYPPYLEVRDQSDD